MNVWNVAETLIQTIASATDWDLKFLILDIQKSPQNSSQNDI